MIRSPQVPYRQASVSKDVGPSSTCTMQCARLHSGRATLGTADVAHSCIGLVLAGVMGKVNLAIPNVQDVLDWVRERHACSTGAQPCATNLLSESHGNHVRPIAIQSHSQQYCWQ
jgi:hypothetical protein